MRTTPYEIPCTSMEDPGCTCPDMWLGTVPPSCPVHNPSPPTITTPSTIPSVQIGRLTFQPAANTGWVCPKCGAPNAPTRDQCCAPAAWGWPAVT